MIRYIFNIIICCIIVVCINSIFNSAHAQIISTYAGNGILGDSCNGCPATDAEIGCDLVTIDLSGNIFIGAYLDKIKKITTSGIVTTVAGIGGYGYSGDGGPATDAQILISGLAVDGTGNIYISDARESCIRKVDTAGIISTFAGIPYLGGGGFGGDGGPATAAYLDYPTGLAADNKGNLFIIDQLNYAVRKINKGIISYFAGNGSWISSGDGGPALGAGLGQLLSIAVDNIGNVYVGDLRSVRKIDTFGMISTIAGFNTGYAGDGGPATDASFWGVYGITVDKWGNIFLADYDNNLVRRIGIDGYINTYAGNYSLGPGFSGDGGLAILSQLNNPSGVTIDTNGILYIADGGNNRIRKVTATTSVANHNNISDIQVYPNPTTGQFTINLPQTTDHKTIIISNILGNIIDSRTVITNAPQKFYITDPPGAYFVEVISGSEVYRQQVMIW